jgi:hypothetical protein
VSVAPDAARQLRISPTSLLPFTKLTGRLDGFKKLDAATFPYSTLQHSPPPHRAAHSPWPPLLSRWASLPSPESGHSPMPLAGSANLAAAAQVPRRCVWPGSQERGPPLAGHRPGTCAAGPARPHNHPWSPAGQNRLFPALLCVARKKGEKLMLQAHISSVLDVSEVYCKCFICVAK